MREGDVWNEEDQEDEGPVLPRRTVDDSADMDITPMIDITFLLLIFFLVCSTMSQATSVKLPPARHGKGVDEQTAVIITIDGEGGETKPRVYLGDGTTGELLPDDHETQQQMIAEAVEAGLQEPGKTSILVKAARGVKAGDVERVSKAAGSVAEEASFHLGVMEVQ
jgi:biopolymer transport protein ExbD